MAKWADYLISSVHYEETSRKRYIDSVRVHKDSETSVGQPNIWIRQDVINSINNSYTFVTILKSGDGEWNKGEDVGVVRINNNYYIRTDANRKEEDNLENLPEF